MGLQEQVKSFKLDYKEFKKLSKKRDLDKAYRKTDVLLRHIDNIRNSKELDSLDSKKKKKLLSELSQSKEIIELFKTNVEAISKYSKSNDKKKNGK